MSKLKIGIVGCGAIGSSLAKAIVRDFRRDAVLSAVYDIDKDKSWRLSKLIAKDNRLSVSNLSQLINKSELVIEAASSGSSWGIAEAALKRHRDIMIMSVGGVLGYYKKLMLLARKYNSKVYIPSGAISGIDALKAASRVEIKRVILTTRKNPVSFRGVKYLEKRKLRLENIKKDTVLFYGPANKAVKYFPQNVNVAAVLSLSGIGPEKTYVRIIASPGTKRNIHEILIESSACAIFTRTENVLHPENPKTSYLAVLAAIATLKQILEPVKIGT